MEKYRNSKPPTVSEKTTGVDAVGGSSCSVNNKEGLVVADTISRSSSERTVMSSESVASPSSDRSLEKNQNGSMSMWLEFDTWLDAQKKAPTDEEREEEEDTSIVRIETNTLQNNAPEKRRKSPLLPKDCRMESGLVAGGPGGSGKGIQEMSVMLGVPGIPMENCPVIPSKAMKNIMMALYEPLVTVGVGALTRTLESPTLLKPRQYADRGRLSLYILPDDSLSLIFEGKIVDPAHTVVDMPCNRISRVQDVSCIDAQASTWEELARFPRWREQADRSIVTIHMLKGDASGRSFYVMPGEGTDPPGVPMSQYSPETIAEFRSKSTRQEKSSGRRYYFWMTGSNLEDDIHALGKMKSYIKHPPTLAQIASVPHAVLESLSTWAGQVDQMNREQVVEKNSLNGMEGSSPILTNPLDAVGAVLSRQVASMSSHCSFTNNDKSAIECLTAATTSANAIFKDLRLSVSCPCCITVSCALVLRGQVSNSHCDMEELCVEEMTMIGSREGRNFAQSIARCTIENLGKIRIQEWSCEDLVRKTRQQRLKTKAARQRRRDIERGYLALHAAGPMIQRAVVSAKLGRKLQDGEIVEYIRQSESEKNAGQSATGDEVLLEEASPKSASEDIGVVAQSPPQNVDVQSESTRKISVHDLNKLFGK